MAEVDEDCAPVQLAPIEAVTRNQKLPVPRFPLVQVRPVNPLATVENPLDEDVEDWSTE